MLFSVVLIHAEVDSAMNPIWHRSRRKPDRLFNLGRFGFGELAQNVVRRIPLGGRLSNTNSQTGNFISSQFVDDVFQAILSAGGTLRPKPHHANRQANIITNDEYVLGGQFVKIACGPNTSAACVHVRHRAK